MTSNWLSLPLIFIGSLGCCPSSAPHCPYGIVLTVSAPDGGPLSGVQATLSGVAFSCASTATGASCEGSGPAPGPLQVMAPGFKSVDLNATVTTTPAPSCGCPGFKLDPSNVTLESIPTVDGGAG
jgi:hypothetical protein